LPLLGRLHRVLPFDLLAVDHHDGAGRVGHDSVGGYEVHELANEDVSVGAIQSPLVLAPPIERAVVPRPVGICHPPFDGLAKLVDLSLEGPTVGPGDPASEMVLPVIGGSLTLEGGTVWGSALSYPDWVATRTLPGLKGLNLHHALCYSLYSTQNLSIINF